MSGLGFRSEGLGSLKLKRLGFRVSGSGGHCKEAVALSSHNLLVPKGESGSESEYH